MKEFDKYIRNKVAEEQTEIPVPVKNRIEEALATLPEKETNIKQFRVLSRVVAAAACVIFAALFLFPNVSVAYAKALEHIPVIGDIVRVVTIRNYFYSDDYHEMDIAVPKMEDEAFDSINADVKELTDVLVDRFYKDVEDIGNEGHSSVYVDYETITNTETWFTLQLCVEEAAGSGNTYYKYYHLNKLTGQTVKLGDMVADESFYDVVEQELKRQMSEAMKQDGDLTYWVEDSTFGEDIVSIGPEHNFYWNEEGNLVIPFDKYEVAPGYMGTPEFVIEKEVIRDKLKEEFKESFIGH